MQKNKETSKVFPPYIDIFVDISVYISSLISSTGASNAILKAAEADAIKVYISPEVIIEIHKVLIDKLNQPLLFQKLQSLIDSVRPVKVIVFPIEVEAVCRYCNDKNDAPMLAAALKSKARFFITLDKKSFKQNVFPVPGHLEILSPGEFMKVLRRIISDKSYLY